MRFSVSMLAAAIGMLTLFALGSSSGCGAIGRAMSRDWPEERVRIETSMGSIIVELDRQHAAYTMSKFLDYVDRGVYDGTIFHRVVDNAVIQGGRWTPELIDRAKADKENGAPDKLITNEWKENGLKNVRGTIAMARTADPDFATREFFINVEDNPQLDTPRENAGRAWYSVFGRVVKGMTVVDEIRRVRTRSMSAAGADDGSMENVPVEPVVILKVTAMESRVSR